MNLVRIAIALTLGAGLAGSQTSGPKDRLTFEVASVKVAPPDMGRELVVRGGPGTSEPGRIIYSGITLMGLLSRAYGVYPDQIVGPGWLITERYLVNANVRPGATRNEFNGMLQNLLVERFRLAFHREKRDFSVYDLVVARGGSKLKEAAAKISNVDAPGGAQPAPRAEMALDREGCPVVRPGVRMALGSMGANNCTVFRNYAISDLVTSLEMLVALESGEAFGPQASQAHIIDKTGLAGEYDFKLKFALKARIPGFAGQPDWAVREGPSLSAALEAQLGLKLEKSRTQLEVLVVDAAEKRPSGN